MNLDRVLADDADGAFRQADFAFLHLDSGGSDGHFNAGDCPIGQALAAAVAFDDLPPAVIAPAKAPLNANEPATLPSLEQPVRRSRDPPA